jgi:hypothetical protein
MTLASIQLNAHKGIMMYGMGMQESRPMARRHPRMPHQVFRYHHDALNGVFEIIRLQHSCERAFISNRED